MRPSAYTQPLIGLHLTSFDKSLPCSCSRRTRLYNERVQASITATAWTTLSCKAFVWPETQHLSGQTRAATAGGQTPKGQRPWLGRYVFSTTLVWSQHRMEEIPAASAKRGKTRNQEPRNRTACSLPTRQIPHLAESSWDRRRSSLASQRRFKHALPVDLSSRNRGPAVVDPWPPSSRSMKHSRNLSNQHSSLNSRAASGIYLVLHGDMKTSQNVPQKKSATIAVSPVYNRQQNAKDLTDIRRLSSRMCRSSV